MTIFFDIDRLRELKRLYPDWVFLIGNAQKNPQVFMGKYRELKTQTLEELEQLIFNSEAASRRDIQEPACNFGPRTGVNDLATWDFDWEFVGRLWQQHFGERAQTMTVRTPNKGYRMLYYTTERSNEKPYKKTLHVEVQNGEYAAIGGNAVDEENSTGKYLEEGNFPILRDNTIIADTKEWLRDIQHRYNFLTFKCVAEAIGNKKHIRLSHEQRLAIVNFMIATDFPDDEIHNFFFSLYDNKGRDYDRAITQSQIESARQFKERGGKPHPCKIKKREDGKTSIPMYHIFDFEEDNCKGCCRKNEYRREQEIQREQEVKELIDELKSKFTFKTAEDIRELYIYHDGIYRKGQKFLENYLEKQLKTKGNTHQINEIIAHLQRDSYVDREEFNKENNIIPVQNGLLNLETLELMPFDPEQIYTYKLKAEYNPKKTAPQFLKFIKEIVTDDKDKLQQAAGYCLIPSYPHAAIFFLHGTGRNGKTTFIKTLIGMFGKQNCSHVNLEEFTPEYRFSQARLYGKLINISSEPSPSRPLETETIKKLTGEDPIDAEVKNQQEPIHFTNKAKLFIPGNKYPAINDDTIAFRERLQVITFPNTFLGKNKIKHIEQEWLQNPDEMSGILNWLIEGMKQLDKNNGFPTDPELNEEVMKFQRASDSVAAFINEQCTINGKTQVTRTDLYEAYKNYCNTNHLDIKAERSFTPRIKQLPNVSETCHKKIRGWHGIELHTLHTLTGGSNLQNSHNSSECRVIGMQTHVNVRNVRSSVSENTPPRPSGSDFRVCCPTCRAQGKENWFATDHDFQAHYKTHHEGGGE